MRPAIFLDRDGVINVNRDDYVKSLAEFQFLPDSLDAFRRLATLNLPVIVVTNQSIIGRGVVTTEIVDDINHHMQRMVIDSGGRLDDIMVCPHRPDEGCDCRKPRPGLLFKAAAKWSLDLPHSFLVGDAESDIQAAHAVGCQPIFVTSGRGNALLHKLGDIQYRGLPVVEDLNRAVDLIVASLSELQP